MIVDSYLETADVAATLLRTPELAARWTEPSVLPEFRISGLAGHLGGATCFLVARSLDADVPDGAQVVDAVEYFVSAGAPGASPDEPRQRRIRELSEEAAGTGPVDLVERVDETLGKLAALLPTLSPDRLVWANRAVLRLDQWLLTRTIELAVHIDDLAVSLDVPTPAIPAEATDLVITALARIATAHHGAVNVLRALSRRERTTGPINAF